MILVVNRFFSKLLLESIGNKFSGITFWPFIVVENHELKKDVVFMNHERIHLRQQAELLVLPFYVWYVLEFVLRWIWCKNAHRAYRNISFEKEAYANEKNLDFLKQRKFFGFWNYL